MLTLPPRRSNCQPRITYQSRVHSARRGGYRMELRKYQPSCVFCEDATDVVSFKGKNVCRKCLKEMGKL